jgi:GT2 family glycosyltransferase
MPPRISVVVVAYRSGTALGRCLDSLEAQDVEVEAIVVNNGPEGPEIADAEGRAFARVVRPGRNVGFGGGCNAGAAVAGGDVLVFLNPDAVAAPGAVRELASTLEDPTVGIAMARLLLLDEPATLNSSGNVVHVAGFGWAAGHGGSAEDAAGEPREVPFASGAAMAMRAGDFRDLGGFTKELFLYQEDLELAWRARMRGLRVVMNPRADVFHEYDFERHGAKRYYLERNRLVFVLSAFSGRMLAVLSPVLVAAEVGTAALAAREGWLGDKARGWAWLARNHRWLGAHRRAVQAQRRVPDRELARHLTPTLDPAQVSLPAVVGALNRLLAGYWALARRAL